MEFDNIMQPVAVAPTFERKVQVIDAIDEDYEYEHGKPIPSNNHSLIQSKISFDLNSRFRAAFDVHCQLKLKLSSGNAVPDICLYPRQPRNWEKDLVFRTDAPILAIEILSPRQSFDDIPDKVHDIYFPAGVKSVWMVLPAVQSVMLFVPGQKVQLFNGGMLHDTVSGFSLDLGEVFE